MSETSITTEKRKPGRPSKVSARKNEILEKAAFCFAMKGYDDTTLDEIGDSLGFNKAALYYYFENKEDLFGQVIHYERNRLWELAKGETEEEDGAENKIIKYFSVRTEMGLVMVKLNELSRSNLMLLNTSFNKAMVTFREKEIDYLCGILSGYLSFRNKDEVRSFIDLLMQVQNAISMSALLLRDIENDSSSLAHLKMNKLNTTKHLLNAFKVNRLKK